MCFSSEKGKGSIQANNPVKTVLTIEAVNHQIQVKTKKPKSNLSSSTQVNCFPTVNDLLLTDDALSFFFAATTLSENQ